MKVNKIFHWLYFLMLLLPIFAIPIYALYMTNKNATFTQQITVSENKVVDFNQLYNGNGRVETIGSSTMTQVNNEIEIDVQANDSGLYFSPYINFDKQLNHKYLMKSNGVSNNFVIYTYINSVFTPLLDNNLVSFEGSDTLAPFLLVVDVSGTYTLYFNVFDLTQMFGSGNEPTATQFNQLYSNYYDYTLSQKQLLKDYDQTTYTDADVGSQFTYMLYNSVDKYFNYDNVFNFGSLYDYLQLNFFNGNAPIGFFIFWHYLIYFLLTSLLWLLFDVLMYVPNLIHRWIDKAEL